MDANIDNQSQRWAPTYLFGSFLLGSLLLCSFGCNQSSQKDLTLFRPNQPDTAPSFATESGDLDMDSMTLTVWHDSFETALEASAQSGKPILANFTGSDWCGWCVKLKKAVFDTHEFKQWARDNVILLELDYPKNAVQTAAIRKQNAELKSRYRISGHPTVLLLSSDGQQIGRKLGYQDNPGPWIASAETQLDHVRTAQSGAAESKRAQY